LHPAARDVLLAALDQGYADPRRLHNPGRTARLLLDNAREAIADALELRPDEVTFTASGTDAVHRGLLGLHAGRARQGDTIVHSRIEHSAVLHAVVWSGGPSVDLGVDPEGRVAPATVAEAVARTRASLVAVQAANHEVGTTQSVAEIAESAGDVPVFMDACAAAGRVPLPDGWAVGAASAHKWGGPPGVGLLLVRKGARWRNPFPGDERVDSRASGFENVPGVLAAAAALQAVVSERAETAPRQTALIDRIRQAVAADVPDVEVVGHPSARLPHLVTFSCLYVDGEALVTELDRAGFAIASGSACTASTLEPSHVLAAMGALTHGNVRLSLGRLTSEEEVERFLQVLPGIVAELRSRVGL
jgi:cysteine desulfurase